jgi:ubiquinone/menaquinone biosynthesis C-methylase UbiE
LKTGNCGRTARKDLKKKISNINYHLMELEIAYDRESPFHIMPTFLEYDLNILDIGCGIGQTLSTNRDNAGILVGLDIDLASLSYGHRRFDRIDFINAAAEDLPFKSDAFDLIISRVSLPYTRIPQTLDEIHRVLKKGGRVWLTLHSFSKVAHQLQDAIRTFNAKGIIFRNYVILNGLLFHFFGKLLPFPVTKRIESFQTRTGILRALEMAGFIMPVVKKRRFFIATAQKRAKD